MKGLIAVGFRMVEPVAKPVGVRLVDLTDGDIDVEALVDFIFAFVGSEDDAGGKNVINLFEGDVLVLHLVPDGVRALHTRLYLVRDVHLVECLPNGFGELLEKLIALFLGHRELTADVLKLFRMFELKAEVLEFGLYFVQSEPIGQRCVDVKRLSSNLILLVGRLRIKCPHVVQAVTNLDQDDSDVITHGEQQFLEVLGLCRSLVSEDATTNLGESVNNLRNLWPEDVRNVFYGVVGIFDNIVEQRRADTGGTKSHLLACNLCDRDGVHDIRFA